MAETLISPGVLARENDQSQITSQPVQAGAAIVGPTVLGKKGIPKLVTSYSEYLANFGSTFTSGSDTYTYFTSISAYNYFNNGGTSLLVDRVNSGSFSAASSSLIESQDGVETTSLQASPYNFTGSAASTARGGESGVYNGVAVLKDGSATTGTTFDVIRSQDIGKLYTGATTADTDVSSIAYRFDQGTNPVDCASATTFENVALAGGQGTGALATIVTAAALTSTERSDISTIEITTPGTGYKSGDLLTIAAGDLGSGMPVVATAITSGLATANQGTAPGSTAASTQALTLGDGSAGTNTFVAAAGNASSVGAGAAFTLAYGKTEGKLFPTAVIAHTGTMTTTINATVTIGIDALVAGSTSGITGGGTGGTVTLTAAGGEITAVTVQTEVTANGISANYTTSSVITLTAADAAAIPALATAFGTIAGANVVASVDTADILTTVESITSTAGGAITGKGYKAGNTITIPSGAVTAITGPDTVFTLTAADLTDSSQASATALQITTTAGNDQDINNNLIIEPTSITLNTQNAADTFAIGNVLSVAVGNIGTPTLPPSVGTAALSVTLAGADLIGQEVFKLETLSHGSIMNSDGSQTAGGALANGSPDNVRWEIQAPNTGSGTFSVIIRQGNDNTKRKSILEIFPNVSLDPNQSNYVARIIGDRTENLLGAGSSDPYIQTTGSYGNGSRYVRVASVGLKTPDYFDNSGIAKSQFTGSIPQAQSGSFGAADGVIVTANQNYYEKINDSDSQGIDTAAMDGYTDAFNLLANKDDYKFNILSSPGLVFANASAVTPINLAISNVQGRGDAICIMDLENYGATITSVTAKAASIDNSYATAYWPWLQLSDPSSGQLVWVPASTLMPGVYAFNDKSAEAWFAPAGINRGGLSTVSQAERKLTQNNRDDLYTGKVNPIATFPGRGVVVFGQKTLQAQASALDRVNVRRLLIELKSYISQIADNLVFEQNTAATRNGFLAQVNPYLESVQQRQGLYAFKVVMDASNNGPEVVDRNQMVGAIYLQPTKTAEFIYLDFNILPTGASFPS